MGTYVNPGNEGFARIVSGEYVDKTGLIALVSAGMGTSRNLVCSTRPRRFGKTFAAESLVACHVTGIPPIVRYGTQSAPSDFWGHATLDPCPHAPHVGFADAEARAIARILRNDYPAILRDWGGPALLVGITYDPKIREHVCRIQEL